MIRVAGEMLVLRPSFAALVAAEGELGTAVRAGRAGRGGSVGAGRDGGAVRHCRHGAPEALRPARRWARRWWRAAWRRRRRRSARCCGRCWRGGETSVVMPGWSRHPRCRAPTGRRSRGRADPGTGPG
ncbi:hypothetical protein AB5I41_24300 [Sphingomonas sp. MMS24-JH45]